MYSLLQNALRA